MSIVKTIAEYELMKKNILKKVDRFLLDFSKFTMKTSPKNWRSSGEIYLALRNAKENIPEYEPLEMKDLENDWVRDQILTDEEKELYNTANKYNL